MVPDEKNLIRMFISSNFIAIILVALIFVFFWCLFFSPAGGDFGRGLLFDVFC